MNETNRDGSNRFLANQTVFVQLKNGSIKRGTILEYEEDGIQVAVRVEMHGDMVDLVFPVERLSHLLAAEETT